MQTRGTRMMVKLRNEPTPQDQYGIGRFRDTLADQIYTVYQQDPWYS